jgi:hypothetical protein
LSESLESEPGQDVEVPTQLELEYAEVDEARKAHRRLFLLALLALILAIVAFFFPRCDFSVDGAEVGAGTGLTDEQLLELIEENCTIPGETGPTGEPGEPGADGSTGPQGPAGATGSQGPAGQSGATGPQGEQGSCGPIGPAGPRGEAGPDGAQGEPGPQGIQGIQGVQGPRGLTGATGPAGPEGDIGETGPPGPPGTGGLGLFGSFHDTCTQPASSANTAYPFRFNNSDFPSSTGVTITGTAGTDGRTFSCVSGSAGSPTITFSGSGVFNIQFSAQYWRTQGGAATDISVWLKKNGQNVAWTNSDFTTESNNEKRVAVINWFVPVECEPTCDSYEIWWSSTKNDMELLAVPPVTSPTRPAIPSLILTVNQVGNLPVSP